MIRGAALRLPSAVGATARAALAGAQLPRRVLCHTRPSQAVAAAASSSRVVATLGGEGVAPLVSQAHCWARCRTTQLPSEFPYRYLATAWWMGLNGSTVSTPVLLSPVRPPPAASVNGIRSSGERRVAPFLEGRSRFNGSGMVLHLSQLRGTGFCAALPRAIGSSGSRATGPLDLVPPRWGRGRASSYPRWYGAAPVPSCVAYSEAEALSRR